MHTGPGTPAGLPASWSLDQEAPFWATFHYPEPEVQEAQAVPPQAWQQGSFYAVTHDALWVELSDHWAQGRQPPR